MSPAHPTEIPGHVATGGRPRGYLRLRACAGDPCHLRTRWALHVHEHGGEPTFGLQEAERRRLQEDGMICPCIYVYPASLLRAPLKKCRGCDRQAWVDLIKYEIYPSFTSTTLVFVAGKASWGESAIRFGVAATDPQVRVHSVEYLGGLWYVRTCTGIAVRFLDLNIEVCASASHGAI